MPGCVKLPGSVWILLVVFAVFFSFYNFGIIKCHLCHFPGCVGVKNWQVLDFSLTHTPRVACFRAQSEDGRHPEDAVLGQAVRDRALPAIYANRPSEQ